MGKTIINVPKKSMDLLHDYSWPGNVRELRNVVERAMILTVGTTLHIDSFGGPPTEERGTMTLGDMEKKHIVQTLEGTGWRVSGRKGAAQALGLKESTLRSRMQKLGNRRPG